MFLSADIPWNRLGASLDLDLPYVYFVDCNESSLSERVDEITSGHVCVTSD